eukprot:gene7263-8073_t
MPLPGDCGRIVERNSTVGSCTCPEGAMDEFLNGLSLYRKPVAKDGSCLFRAVSEHVYNTQEKHLDVRRECISYMKENEDRFSAFVTGSYEHHLYGLQNPKEWAGQVEIAALSLLYHYDFLIYQEVNQEPRSVTSHGFEKKIMLCFSNGNHYDCVYSNTFKEDAGLMQSILYELLYETVLPECKKREDLKCQTNEVNPNGNGEATGDDNKNEGTNIKGKDLKNNKGGIASLSVSESKALYEIQRSLDANFYRNIALEVWEQSKREQTQADRAVAMKLQFKVGEYCMAIVGIPPTADYVKAQIKEFVGDKYVVYAPEYRESYEVHIEDMKPLLKKPEQVSYEKLPGYYRKVDESQKDFQQPKKRQQKASSYRGNRDEDIRFRKSDGRCEKGEGRYDNRSNGVQGGSQQRRDRRERRSGQDGDRGRNDRRDTERKARSGDRSGRKVDAQFNRSSSEEQKANAAKKGDDNVAEKKEKAEDISRSTPEDVSVTESTAMKTLTGEEKEKTAKQNESPAAFWSRMRKPEPPSDKLKGNTVTAANQPTSSKSEDAKETDEVSKLNLQPSNKKEGDAEAGKSKSEAKENKVNTDKVNPKAQKMTESGNKQTAAKSCQRKDNVADKRASKSTNEKKEEASVPTALNKLQVNRESSVDKHEAVAEERIKENGMIDVDASQHASTPSVSVKEEFYAPSFDNIARQSNKMQQQSHSTNHVTSNHCTSSLREVLNTSADVSQDNIAAESANTVANGDADTLEEVEINGGQPQSVENCGEFQDALYSAEGQLGPVSAAEEFAEPRNGFHTADEVAGGEEAVLEQKFEQRNDQQRIRILTKNNEDQFRSTYNRSPEQESRRATAKKVSFGNVEFSEDAANVQQSAAQMNDDEGIAQTHHSMSSNDVIENNHHPVYKNASYNVPTTLATTGLPVMPPTMMMPPMMHANEQMQLPSCSIDPEGRDLPQHMPTLQYFFNLGVQFFMMQQHMPAFVNMPAPQMQVNAAAMRTHSYPPIPATGPHAQMPYRYGQAGQVVDEIGQVEHDQQEDYQASALSNDQFDAQMMPKQQSLLQPRHFHNQPHQTTVNQYEQPPRMRRGRGAGRGSTLMAPPVFKRTNAVPNKHQPQPRNDKRNYNVNDMHVLQQQQQPQMPRKPLPYYR